MSHLDEGTLHALLDGELELNEVAEIQAHLGSCSACGLRLREVKEFLGESDRLIASVDLDAPLTRPARLPEPPSRPEPVAAAPMPARPEPSPPDVRDPQSESRPASRNLPPSGWEPWNEQVPVILVPDNESPAERRRRRLKRFGWAAMILMLIGAGVVGRLSRPSTTLGPASASRGTGAGADSNAVVSQAETGQPEQPQAQPAESNRDALALKSEPAQKPVAKVPAPSVPQTARAAPDSARHEAARKQPARQQKAAAARKDTSLVKTVGAVDSSTDTMANAAGTDSAPTEDLATVRQRASEALAQLDKEKRRQQAAAATAALDAQRTRRASQTAARAATPTPPPTPPTMEERAQVYLRIGLDEASRQLGGPVHVIEGMSPLFMGLAQGVVVPGADGTRPAVRVVYQDAQGRLIFLDQQTLRPGQLPPTGSPLGWTMGGTALWLHGEAGPEILRTYRARVR